MRNVASDPPRTPPFHEVSGGLVNDSKCLAVTSSSASEIVSRGDRGESQLTGGQRAEPRSESWIRVDIDLHDLQVSRVTFGEVFKHGPDHPTRPAPPRQKSTTTGTEALGRDVSASRTHGSVDLHCGHRGTPRAIGATRLRALQVGQLMTATPTRVEPGRSLGRLATPPSA